MPDVKELQKAVQFLAGVCDGASLRDGQGFNATDTGFGKSLANQENWTMKQAVAARRLLIKYKGQLQSAGFDVENLFTGEITGSVVEKKKQEAQVVIDYVNHQHDMIEILLKCPKSMNNIVKTIPYRRFDNKNKGWHFKLTERLLQDVFNKFPQAKVEDKVRDWLTSQMIHRQKMELLKKQDDIDIDVPNAEKLRSFQRVGVKFLSEGKRVLLADDMGLGKTVQTIIAAEMLQAKNVLVVCPNGLKVNWKNEVKKWSNKKAKVLRSKKNRQHKEEVIQNFEEGYLMVNYETVRRGKYKNEDGKMVEREHDFIDMINEISWDLIVVDEAHKIKNRKAQQTKDIQALTRDQDISVFLLTGTPIMNRVDELWALLNTLYPNKYNSFWNFVKEFANAWPGKWGWEIDPHPKDPEKLREELNPIMLRREKKKVLKDLPEKTYQQVWVEMDERQEKLYREMEKQSIIEIDKKLEEMGISQDTENISDKLVAPGILAQLTRCRQIAVSPNLVGDKTLGTKIETLMDIIEGTDQKIVVFSQFKEAINLVSGILSEKEIKHVTLTGDTAESQRQKAVDDFQNDPNVKVFACTMQAGGVGITLTEASIAVFLDKHWTPATNEQAVDRIYRIGQTDNVTIMEILAYNTSFGDEFVEEVLNEKVSIIEAVLRRKTILQKGEEIA